MAAIYSEWTWYWNGTAIEGARGDVTWELLSTPRGTPAEWKRQEREYYGSVRREVADPVRGDMSFTVLLRGYYSGASSDPAVIQRAIADDVEAIGAEFNPDRGLAELRLDRKDSGNNSISRVATCHVLRLPVWVDGDRQGASGYSEGYRPHGWHTYQLDLRCPHGFIQQRTATTESIQATTGGATTSFSYDGQMDAPVRLEVTAVSGATIFTIVEDDSGDTLATITSTGFSTSSYVDFGYTDEGVPDWSSDISLAAGDWAKILRSTSEWTLTSNSGTVDVDILYKSRYGTY